MFTDFKENLLCRVFQCRTCRGKLPQVSSLSHCSLPAHLSWGSLHTTNLNNRQQSEASCQRGAIETTGTIRVNGAMFSYPAEWHVPQSTDAAPAIDNSTLLSSFPTINDQSRKKHLAGGTSDSSQLSKKNKHSQYVQF